VFYQAMCNFATTARTTILLTRHTIYMRTMEYLLHETSLVYITGRNRMKWACLRPSPAKSIHQKIHGESKPCWRKPWKETSHSGPVTNITHPYNNKKHGSESLSNRRHFIQLMTTGETRKKRWRRRRWPPKEKPLSLFQRRGKISTWTAREI